ncbi:hypothetical protein ACHAXR_002059, partial [Thalassiosira sp. AJA248-18]
MNSFCLRSSLSELVDHFNEKKSGTLRIHVCTEGEVLGTTIVDLRQLIALEKGAEGGDKKDCEFEGRMIQNDYNVKSRSTNAMNGEVKEQPHSTCSPRLAVRLCIDRGHSAASSKYQGKTTNEQQQPTAAVYSSISSQTTTTISVDQASSPMKNVTTNKDPGKEEGKAFKPLENREEQLKAREAKISMKEKEMYEAVASLEKKRCEWEQWRHRQELEWHEKLRTKEAAMMRVVEERVCAIENERLRSMEISKNEYEKLETRLRKSLIEVEAKERQLKDIELGYQNERKRKLAELELKEKLINQELKHTVELTRAKVNAAVDQAAVAEKSAAAANHKVKQIESEMDQLREQHRKTPEVTLLHELAGLKGQLADSQRRMEAMKAEKEQFRSNVHKLAKALRQERQKARSSRESSNQQVRLSYDVHEKSFVLGGEQDEIQRILGDLNKMSMSQIRAGQ